MIIANEGNIFLKVNNVEITLEFNMIIDSILEDAPEIVIATLCKRTDELIDLMSNVNPKHLDISEHVVKTYKESKEKHKNG